MSQSEQMFGVDVVDRMDLIHAIAVEDEGEHGTEPHTRHDACAQIAPPQNFAPLGEQRHLERVGGLEEHLHVGIHVEIGTVYGEDCARRTCAEVHRDRTQLPDARAKRELEHHGEFGGVCTIRAGHSSSPPGATLVAGRL